MNARRLLDGAGMIALAPATATALHLAGLTLAGLTLAGRATAQRRDAGGPVDGPAAGPEGPAGNNAVAALPARFTFVVPAHNEQAGIATTVASLVAVDYPPDARRILVVADNCSDETAARATAAGADVLVRTDAVHRGKGYALAAGFRAALSDPAVAAVVVVDADTVVSPNLLRAAAAGLAEGALVMQADYRVREPGRTWRTTLMEIAFTAMHTVRNDGRERLGLSVGLRGNGMVFSRAALERCPYNSFGLVEDIEYAARLVGSGIRVALLRGATVRGDMPDNAKDASSQRLRWEEGRRRLRREAAPRLARQALTNRSAMLADAAAELAAPPLARVAAPAAAALALSLGLRRGRALPLTTAAAGVGLVGLGLHVAVAWWRSGTGLSGLRALARVPAYAVWKLGLRGSRGKVDAWVRTARSEEQVAI